MKRLPNIAEGVKIGGMIKTYYELSKFHTFDERFDYLKIVGVVGKEVFGFDRYLNQILYNSSEWKTVRNKVIVRDNGCDLGLEGYDICGKILIHHINPITVEDIKNRNPMIFDLNNLICVTHNTHNAIHYGNADSLFKSPIERTTNDTCPWKRQQGG